MIATVAASTLFIAAAILAGVYAVVLLARNGAWIPWAVVALVLGAVSLMA